MLARDLLGSFPRGFGEVYVENVVLYSRTQVIFGQLPQRFRTYGEVYVDNVVLYTIVSRSARDIFWRIFKFIHSKYQKRS
jgi:hypothetical protein